MCVMFETSGSHSVFSKKNDCFSPLIWVLRDIRGAVGVNEGTGISGNPAIACTVTRTCHSSGLKCVNSSRDDKTDRIARETWEVCDNEAWGIHVTFTHLFLASDKKACEDVAGEAAAELDLEGIVKRIRTWSQSLDQQRYAKINSISRRWNDKETRSCFSLSKWRWNWFLRVMFSTSRG